MVRPNELSFARRGANQKLAARRQGARPSQLTATFIGLDPDDNHRGIVSFSGNEVSVLSGPHKLVPGSLVAVEVDSANAPIRIIGPVTTRPEGLDEAAEAPAPVIPMASLAPLTAEQEELIQGSAERIEQVAEDTNEALSDLTNALAGLDAATSRTQFKVGPPDGPGRVEGDQWIEIDNYGRGVVGWRWTGSNWVEYQLTDAMFDSVGINKLAVKDGHFDSAIIEQLGVDGMDARIVRTSALHVAAGNLIPNGDGEIDHSTYPGMWKYAPGVVPPGSGAVGSWEATGAGGPLHGSSNVRVKIDQGEDYLLTFWVKQATAGTFRFALATHNDDYQQVDYYYRGPTYSNAGDWEQYSLDIPKAWLTGKYLQIYIRNSTTPTIQTAGWDLRPKVGGRLIVDGVMDGKTIIGGEFLTSSDTANAGIWDHDGLRIYRDGILQAELSPNNPFGLTVRHPTSGQMLPLSTHIFGNRVWAPTAAFDFDASTYPGFTEGFGNVVGTFTAISDRYMISHTAQPPGTHLDDGWYYQNYGVEFHRPATGWRQRASMGSIQGPSGGAMMDIGTITLAIGAEYEVRPMYRAAKRSGTTGQARVTNRLVHLQPIH